jgi:YidC/Oxa1 family membrane protein insertase
MGRRFLLTMILIFIFFFIYQLFFFKPPPPEKKELKEEKTVEEKILPPPEKLTFVEENPVIVETPLIRAEFSRRGGLLIHYYLKKYKTYTGEPLDLIPPGTGLFEVSLEDGEDLDLIFSPSKDTLHIGEDESGELVLKAQNLEKKFHFKGNSYLFNVEIGGDGNYTLSFAGINLTEKNRKEDLSHLSFLVYRDKLEKNNLKKKPMTIMGDISWIGVRSKYFLFAIIKEDSPFSKIYAERKEERIGFTASIDRGRADFSVYFGPIDYFILKEIGYGLEKVYDFGFALVRPFSRIILYALKFFHNFIPNYGWVIVIFSIVMKIVFWPFTYRSLKSMRKMQELKPKLDSIRKIYKDDPQRMQKEMMELYKKYKVNPFSGCLILILQLPIFWALYQILKTTIDLRAAPFVLWIQDLSSKDPYYVLPILMGAASLGQAFLQPAQDQQSRMISLFFPLFLTFIFLNFPAGIVLYWLTYSLLGLLEQVILKRQQKSEG